LTLGAVTPMEAPAARLLAHRLVAALRQGPLLFGRSPWMRQQSRVVWSGVARENEPARGAPPEEEMRRNDGFAEIAADFARKLDLWGAYHRMVVGSLTMAVTFSILPQPGWLLAFSALYLLVAALLPRLLDLAGDRRRKARLRVFVMVLDVALVTLFASYWGARTSPSAFMYVPMVSGWTLIPQRHIGRVSAVAALAAYGGLLLAEQRGWLGGTRAGDALALHSTTSAFLYFATLACALTAVHGLVGFTVAGLLEHNQVVTRLTVEKRAREREMQLASQLEEAQRLEALGRLAGGVAHDINNVLTVLMGCAELADAAMEQNPESARRALADLQSAAERGGALTAQLLDFASRRFASPIELDLNEAVKSAGQLLERLLDASVTLQVRVADEPCFVRLDPGGLERILLNLAINARDAMADGGSLAISVSIEPRDGVEYGVLTVADSGVGVAPEHLPRIFEPFFTTKERGKGTGLGLASVYGIVKQSGGQIDVDSRLGVGTTFRMRFARLRAEERPSAPLEPAPRSGSGLVLLVDDDAEVRAILLAHLESSGYTVLAAAGGAEALALLARESGHVRLLLSDISMPGMSGVELARRVKQAHPALPILLISGYSEELQGDLQGCVRFLGKPFSRQTLLAEVRAALTSSS